MDSGSNYAEYSVTQANEGKFVTKRLIFYIAYALIVIVPITILAICGLGGLAAIFGAVIITLVIALIFFTRRLICPEYKYVIELGSVRFYENYGKKDKLLAESKVKEIEIIAPYTDEYNAPAKAADIEVTYDLRGTTKTEDAYFAVFTYNKKKTLVLFEGCEKTVKMFHYYNKQNTVQKEQYRH